MISLNTLSPPPPSTAELTAVFNLIALARDPAAAEKRVGEIQAAAVAATMAVETAQAEQRQLKAARAEHEEFLSKSRAELEADLKTKRVAHERELKAATDALRQKTAETDRLHAQAKADGETAATLRKDLERRLETIRSAAA